MRSAGFELRIATFLYADSAVDPSTPSVWIGSPPELSNQYPITLRVLLQQESGGRPHSYILSPPDAERIEGWLRQAATMPSGGAVHTGSPIEHTRGRTALIGEHRESPDDEWPEYGVDLTEDEARLFFVDDERFYGYALNTEQALALAQGLRGALEGLEEQPPKFSSDLEIAKITGQRPSGEDCTIVVEIDRAVGRLDDPRLKLLFVGTWWIDPEGEELMDALEQAATAIDRKQSEDGALFLALSDDSPEPWMRVTTQGDKVELRLFDDIVEELHERGEVYLSADGARALSEAIHVALQAIEREAPYVFTDPEPNLRIRSKELWADQKNRAPAKSP